MKTNYPDSLTIQQYLEGKLDPEVMHQLEKQALDDPFLWDALEGYSTHADPAADLSILQRQLHERIVHLQENKKVFDLTWQRLSVAAAAAVLFVSAGVLFWMNSHSPAEQIAANHKQVEVNVMHPDSVEAVINSKDKPLAASSKVVAETSDKAKVTAYNPAKPIKEEVIVPSKNEAEISKKESVIASNNIEPQTMSAASAPAVRMAKVAKSNSESPAALAEVMVAAQPENGWNSYREYLDLNAKKFKVGQALKGSVLLSLHIEKDGKLSSVKVVRGLNEVYDKEAVRIVKEGPAWAGAPDGKDSDMMVEVIF